MGKLSPPQPRSRSKPHKLSFSPYAFRPFELIAKLVAVASLASLNGKVIPPQTEVALEAAQALLLAFCFAPLWILALRRWFKWYWPAGLILVFLCAFQYTQQRAYQ